MKFGLPRFLLGF